MEFRTSLTLPPSPHSVTLQTPILAMGSCFAEVMGEKLLANKFQALVNPFGVIFNPVSLAELLAKAVNNEPLNHAGLIQTREGWRHFDLHSRIWANDPDQLLAQANEALTRTHVFLQSAEWIILTLGTAFVYRRKATGTIVANCHKVPSSQFFKELLPQQEITHKLETTLREVITRHPAVKIVLTVSPVRHLKDTLPMNALSKALLRVACHQLSEALKPVTYFPAYEIMIDDLRDYRFYGPDMIHPSEVAEDYIWKKFSETYFDPSTLGFLPEWAKIRQAIQHRPLHPGSAAHVTFLKQTLSRLQMLRNTIPVEEEIRSLELQLSAFNPTT